MAVAAGLVRSHSGSEVVALDLPALLVDEKESLLERAEGDVREGRPAMALTALSAMAPATSSRLRNRPALFARFLDCYAAAHKLAGNVGEAIGAYEQLQLLAMQEREISYLFKAVIGKLVVLTNSDLPELAEVIAAHHDDAVASSGDIAVQVEFAARKARIFEELGDLERARHVVETAILPRSGYVDPPGYQLDRQLLACRLYLSGPDRSWTRAEKALANASDLVKTEDNLQRRAQFATTLGLFEYQTGNHSDSWRYWNLAKSVLDSAAIRSFHHDQLGRLLKEQGGVPEIE